MKDRKIINKLKVEIQEAVSAYENNEFVDIQTETTELVLIARKYINKSDDSQFIKSVAIAMSELIPEWIKKGDSTWAAVDYLIEKLELDKTINNDFSVISETLDFFIGNDEPINSKARFFLLEAFAHSGGKLQQRTIINEEKYFKKDNPSFWLGLVIDVYQAEYIKGRIKEYIIESYIDVDGLIPLIPEIYDKVGKDFPGIMISFIDTFQNQKSKNVLKEIFVSFMGESPEEYESKTQNNKLKQSLLTNNPAYINFRNSLNIPNRNVSEQCAVIS